MARSKGGTSTCGRSSLAGSALDILPGGLTRVALEKGIACGELLAGRREQGHLGAAPILTGGSARRAAFSSFTFILNHTRMLSRVADNLYWMARFMERAENLARLLQASNELLLDGATFGSRSFNDYWDPVLTATAMEDQFRTLYPPGHRGGRGLLHDPA